MTKKSAFGERVVGYDIAVLNEREIRAAAGILFLATFISLVLILSKGNFVPIKYVITFFLTDFIIRVFVQPRYAPTLIFARLIVRNQTPEYVGAAQKKFAWIVGLILSASMFVLMVLVNSYSPISGIACMLCLLFLFFESAFGICLACKFYALFNKGKTQYCPGEVCEAKTRQPIQKISALQLLILVAFITLLILAVFLLKDEYGRKPHNLFGKSTSTQPAKK